MTQDDSDFVARIISWEGVTLVNICDRELVGRTVKGGPVDMHISKDYFGGELVDGEKALQLVRSSTIANLVGERIVDMVVEAKLASALAVKKIGSTSFLMIFKFTR